MLTPADRIVPGSLFFVYDRAFPVGGLEAVTAAVSASSAAMEAHYAGEEAAAHAEAIERARQDRDDKDGASGTDMNTIAAARRKRRRASVAAATASKARAQAWAEERLRHTVVAVDLARDHTLQRHVTYARAGLAQAALDAGGDLSLEARVAWLARFVAVCMGDGYWENDAARDAYLAQVGRDEHSTTTAGAGSGAGAGAAGAGAAGAVPRAHTPVPLLQQSCAANVGAVQKQLGCAPVVALGQVRTGSAAMRAILFKVLADQPGIDIPAWLVRGNSLWLKGGLGVTSQWVLVRVNQHVPADLLAAAALERGDASSPAQAPRPPPARGSLPPLSLAPIPEAPAVRQPSGAATSEWVHHHRDGKRPNLSTIDGSGGARIRGGIERERLCVVDLTGFHGLWKQRDEGSASNAAIPGSLQTVARTSKQQQRYSAVDLLMPDLGREAERYKRYCGELDVATERFHTDAELAQGWWPRLRRLEQMPFNPRLDFLSEGATG